MSTSASAEAVVRDYYDALRDGDPLPPYFLDNESTVKFGISDSLFGGNKVTAALEEQTETTADWTVESQQLVVDERAENGFATFADEVTMAWTDVESGDRHRFDSRWSGTLVARSTATTTDDGPAWRFASMHVSASREL
ncbi:nuclear transport factor 2 family protein [Natrinema salifodinae]|uniref:SnoaL-like domain-containing protein n=1 Tax=Natrinema salifodinae TaxID=1202768 RepID=A0A1I0P5L8_9EURY|nr:nuclear transport factor 2 family protein [Natrinema salifodinae]SEW09480.1 SnoaL-like domain-containing protein [Natrinema salifodinae]